MSNSTCNYSYKMGLLHFQPYAYLDNGVPSVCGLLEFHDAIILFIWASICVTICCGCCCEESQEKSTLYILAIALVCSPIWDIMLVTAATLSLVLLPALDIYERLVQIRNAINPNTAQSIVECTCPYSTVTAALARLHRLHLPRIMPENETSLGNGATVFV